MLPNAWDVPSALAYVDVGFPAVSTTSFGVAVTSGRPDGRRASRDATLSLVLDLDAISVPLSVDIEDGYADHPAEVAAFVSLLGAAGVNLEDSTGERLVEPDAHAAKIAAVKHRTPTTFVNVRIDTYRLDQDAHLDATLLRAHAYVAAGADGIFVPDLHDLDELSRLSAALDVPVNTLPVPGATLADLAAAGVRRVNTGSAPYRAAHHAAVATAIAVRDDAPAPPTTPHGVIQRQLLSRS